MAPNLPLSDVVIVRRLRNFERNNSRGFIWLQNVSKQRPIEIGIFIVVVMLFLVVLMVVLFLRNPNTNNCLPVNTSTKHDEIIPRDYNDDITISDKLRIVSRLEWGARPPINTTTLGTPVPYVIIHQLDSQNCSSFEECVFYVRIIQELSMDLRGFHDIAYNFLVGGDGFVYEGRGWTAEGSHTLGYHTRGISIALIGTFINEDAPGIQILACKRLIQKGVELGYIRKDYKLLGARELSGMGSLGATVYTDMTNWTQWADES